MDTKEWMETWLELCVKRNAKLKTYNKYKDTVQHHILPYLQGKELQQLDYACLMRMVSVLQITGNKKTGKGLSAASINGILTILKISLNEEMAFGYLEYNVCAKIKKLKSDEKKVNAFTVEEQRRMEAYIMQQGCRDLGVLISLRTGLRIGEVLALCWEDIDLKQGILYVTKNMVCTRNMEGKYVSFLQSPKSFAGQRAIPLPRDLKRILKQIRPSHKTGFVVQKKGKPYTVRAYQYRFARLLQKTGIMPKGFHALRHTFASRAIECGVDVKSLSLIMGHSSPVITLNRYAHIDFAAQKKVMKRMDEAVLGFILYSEQSLLGGKSKS